MQRAEQLYAQSQALLEVKEYDGALKTVDSALRYLPRNTKLLIHAVNVCLKSGDVEKGYQYQQRLVRTNPSNAAWYEILAWFARENQDFEVARRYARAVLNARPSLAEDVRQRAERTLKRVTPRSYQVTWKLTPEPDLIQAGYVRVSLPTRSLPYQSVTFAVTGARDYKVGTENGNEFLLVAPQGSSPFTLTSTVTLRPYSYKPQFDRLVNDSPLPPDVLPYLGVTARVDPGSPRVKALAATLKAKDGIATVNNVLTWLKSNVQFRYPNPPLQSIEEVLDKRYAQCEGIAALFVGLCRAAGIPAREVYAMVDERGGTLYAPEGRLGSHAAAEVFLSGVGWVPVEPQWRGSLGSGGMYHIRVNHFDPKKCDYLRQNMGFMDDLYPKFEDLPTPPE